MIRVNALRQYRQGQCVLDLPRLALKQGASAVLIGPSGSGKSTLLAVLAGLLRPTSGEVWVANQRMGDLPQGAVDTWRLSAVGFVPQNPHLLDAIPVAENLQLAQFLSRQPRDPIDALVSRLGLGPLMKQRPHTLSRGQAQRVAIARALVANPAVILVDEPTANLDDDSALAATQLLGDTAKWLGATLLVATHDRRVVAQFEQSFSLSRPLTEAQA